MPLNANYQVNPGEGRGPRENRRIGHVAWTIGDESGSDRTITVQCHRILTSGDGTEAPVPIRVMAFDDATRTVTSDSPIGAVSTGTVVVAHSAGKVIDYLTDATGKLVFTFSDAGTDSFVLGFDVDGQYYQTDAITFAA